MVPRFSIVFLALSWLLCPSLAWADEEYTPRYTSEFLRGDEMTILLEQDRLRMQQLGPAQGGVITDNRHHATLKNGEKVYSYTHVNPADRVTHAYYVLETGAWVNPYNIAEADLISQNWFKGQYLDPMGGGTGYGEAIVRPFTTQSRPYLVVNPAGTHDFYFSYEAVARTGGIRTKIVPHFVKDATVVDLTPCEFVTSCADIHKEIMDFPKCPTAAWYNWFWCNSWYFKQWVKACVYSRLKYNTDEYVNAGGELHNEEHKLTLTVDGYKREELESIAATKNVRIGSPGDTEIVAVTFADNLKTVEVTFRATTLTTGEKTVVFGGKEVHKRIRFIKPIHDVPDTHVGVKKFAGFRLAGTLAKEPITTTSTGKAIVFADQSYQCWTFSGTRFCSPTQIASCSYGGDMDGLDYVTCGYTPGWENIKPGSSHYNVNHCQDRANVCGVLSVRWVEATTDGGGPLDDNLGVLYADGGRFIVNLGNGLRIFPDKQVPTDKVRWNVIVEARVVGRQGSNHTVYVKSFDVDDPTDIAPPVDDDFIGKTFDNRGDPVHGRFRSTGTRTASYPVTIPGDDPTGYGIGSMQRMFRVTMQPGNNFRVVAVCGNPNLFDGIEAAQADEGRSGLLYSDQEGDTRIVEEMFYNRTGATIQEKQLEPQVPVDRLSTVVLTVWRKLHIEIDSMRREPLPTNTDNGVSKSPDIQKIVVQDVTVNTPNPGQTTLTVANLAGQVNQFEGGYAWVSAWDGSLMKYRVISNDIGTDSVPVVINRVLTQGEINIIRRSFEVYIADDDKPEAQLPYFPDVNQMTRDIFAQIYVLPVAVPQDPLNPRRFVDFVLNGQGANQSAQDVISGDPIYWTALLTVCYQYLRGEDGDPDAYSDNDRGTPYPGPELKEKPTSGAANNAYALIFKETIHDMRGTLRKNESENESLAISHELLHTGGGTDHDDSTPNILYGDASNLTVHLTPKLINIFRGLLTW